GLAWLLHRSSLMLPIPGTSSLAHLEENMAARKIQLTEEEWNDRRTGEPRMINHATKRIRSTASSRRTNWLIFHIPARDCENSRNTESAQKQIPLPEKNPFRFSGPMGSVISGSLSGRLRANARRRKM